MRLRHPTELSLHLLQRLLFQVGEAEEQLVCAGRQRAGARGTVAAPRAGLPSKRVVLPVGPKGLLNMGQQGLKFGGRKAGQ
jgi:hypothetical protein